MACQATFSKEVSRSQNRDNGLFALFGDNGELDLPLPNIEDSLRRVPLRKNLLVLRVVGMRLSLTDSGEKALGIEIRLRSGFGSQVFSIAAAPPFARPGRTLGFICEQFCSDALEF